MIFGRGALEVAAVSGSGGAEALRAATAARLSLSIWS